MDTKELEKWFMSLVADKLVSDYKNVLKSLTPILNARGIGQQHDSGGEPRGRLFLPTSKCLSAAPKTADDKFLGVNQNPACWERVIDVVNNGKWVWLDRGGPEYLPVNNPTPIPAPIHDFPDYEKDLGGDAYATAAIGKVLEEDYNKAGQSLNAGSATWFARTYFDALKFTVVNGLEGHKAIEESVAKRQPEWRKALDPAGNIWK
jgi:hypothetical protein